MYVKSLGAEVVARKAGKGGDGAQVEILLPFSEQNSNAGGALHGGVAASLIAMGSAAAARDSNEAAAAAAAAVTTSMVQVQYLAAAVNEDVRAVSTVVRAGKSFCFVETTVTTVAESKAIAKGLATLSITPITPPNTSSSSTAETSSSNNNNNNSNYIPFPAPQGRRKVTIGEEGNSADDDVMPVGMMSLRVSSFIQHLGIRIAYMKGGEAVLTMPCAAHLTDGGSGSGGGGGGGVHEGAINALVDTCGAMAAWAATLGNMRNNASTVSLQVQHGLVQVPAGTKHLVAYGRTQRREGDLFWADVDVLVAGTDVVVARGTVLYRIAGSVNDAKNAADRKSRKKDGGAKEKSKM